MTTVAFFDIDGTLITESIWDYFLRQPEIAPGKREVYVRFLPAFVARKAGLLPEASFREAWVKQMARLLRGWKQERIDALFDRIVFEEFGDRFRKDVVSHVEMHKDQGTKVVLVSGMFDGFAARFARLLGIETGLGTRLNMRDGSCTGRIDGRCCAGAEKPEFMRRYLGQRELTNTYGYADSYSDVPMLSTVTHPVATYPDEQLRAHALKHGWALLPTE